MDLETPSEIPDSVPTAPSPADFDPRKLQNLMERIEAEQNLPMAILGGALAAGVGAAVWAGVTVVTKVQIGWMAVGVGYLCGYAVRRLGRGITKPFGFVAAGFALLGCLLGNLLSSCGFIAQEYDAPYFKVVGTMFTNPAMVGEVLVATFHPMDVLFYAIALFEGYRTSFRRIQPEDLAEATS